MKNKFIDLIKSIFQKKAPQEPHVCEHKYLGCVSHFGQVSDVKQSIENPSWYHYPSMEVRQKWLDRGITSARVFQSHWQCACTDNVVFFFLTLDPNTIDSHEVESHNPFCLNSSAGKSLNEVTNEMINEFC